MIFRRFFVLAFAVAAFARGQEPLNAPVPFVPQEAEIMSPGQISKDLEAARRAQDFGINSLAIELYTKLLNQPAVDRAALNLALATVLLDDGKPAEAERVL